MKKAKKISVLLLIAVCLIAVSCSSSKGFSKKGSCGCPNKQGMVGY
jgi:hypothetical protein